jgi:hypothetical protein
MESTAGGRAPMRERYRRTRGVEGRSCGENLATPLCFEFDRCPSSTFNASLSASESESVRLVRIGSCRVVQSSRDRERDVYVFIYG